MTIPDFVFPAVVYLTNAPKLATILVYSEGQPNTIFIAWWHDQDKPTSVRLKDDKWVDTVLDKETILSSAIGVAIKNNYKYFKK